MLASRATVDDDGAVAQGQGVTCRTCGYTSPHGTPTCGNCAADLRAQPPRGRPLAAPRSGARRLVAVLLLLGVLGGGLSAATEAVGDAVDWFDDATGGQDAPPGAAAPATVEAVVDGFGSVPAVARALRAGGLPCGRVKVDSADDVVATGSCQSRGTHVQINLYFSPETIRFARREIFDAESPFAFAHADNWWVVSQPDVARRAARILGGRAQVPR